MLVSDAKRPQFKFLDGPLVGGQLLQHVFVRLISQEKSEEIKLFLIVIRNFPIKKSCYHVGIPKRKELLSPMIELKDPHQYKGSIER